MINLENVRKGNVAVRGKIERIQALKDMREKITGAWVEEKVKSTPPGDKLGELTVQIMELEDELFAEVKQIENELSKAESYLFEVCNPTEYAVMHRLYILGWSKADVALDLNMTRQRVWQIEKNVLQRINSN